MDCALFENFGKKMPKGSPGEDWPYIQHIPDIQFFVLLLIK